MPTILKLASFNIQAGIGSRRMRHMLTYSFRYVLPHRQAIANLDRIAEKMRGFDLVGLQEADCGSFRSNQVQQAQYIALRADIPFCLTQVTRDIGNIASIGLGLLSRYPCIHSERHRLPASRHGRGLLETVFHINGRDMAVFVTHLSLKQSSRVRQFHHIAQHMQQHKHAILMGDLNCEPDSSEFMMFLNESGLHQPPASPTTFPSWQPQRRIDYILTRGEPRVSNLEAMPFVGSDHLPIIADITF
ncbi:MAG: endonuclease [Zetaproteobacteria bacterium CG06_land_8_20_14_3_00_59_53]|nr:MAG: endonuclease [Zetaproteobacteria bacterium CG23_combo_of_CG06-09_8_20_14_all_59_86]PIQ64674.1 MAG: endonuclease [Zetaproteobacteria bacterium CG11_big_fil_rev_8_21_14_0_20_59_439]PIU71161.1 MAG: endonuclease [Zetaproteobacteria bacterium CG06_land_8_20_14_3_00_59_53]PIU96654.1 MAG: endonuclease [Zetaproteobacteria bacterium CG03_land_8_20_14_0_80_59_51]PIY46258.1 MAG: endonuclease [Zetaproteobacteria bacterium CG_4_10_14_0_8_um_filter_59_127]PJC16744.1 MAG: endonuclease [Zetaproteobact